MTTRHSGYIVALDQDTREDDAADIITAIRLITGVLSVEPVTASAEIHIAESRARIDIEGRIFAALHPERR